MNAVQTAAARFIGAAREAADLVDVPMGAAEIAALIADALATISPDDAETAEHAERLSEAFAAIARELGA